MNTYLHFLVVKLPRPALKYTVSREIAHISSEKQSVRFWNTLKIICLKHNIGKKLLADCRNSVLDNSALL